MNRDTAFPYENNDFLQESAQTDRSCCHASGKSHQPPTKACCHSTETIAFSCQCSALAACWPTADATAQLISSCPSQGYELAWQRRRRSFNLLRGRRAGAIAETAIFFIRSLSNVPCLSLRLLHAHVLSAHCPNLGSRLSGLTFSTSVGHMRRLVSEWFAAMVVMLLTRAQMNLMESTGNGSGMVVPDHLKLYHFNLHLLEP